MGLAGSAMEREEGNSEVTETQAEGSPLLNSELLEASASSEMAEGSLCPAPGSRVPGPSGSFQGLQQLGLFFNL